MDSQTHPVKNFLFKLMPFFLLLIVWIKAPLNESLWLDETIAAWITEGSTGTVIERSSAFQGQSPFYFLLLHKWRNFFGHSELMLRLPSFLLLIASAASVFAIARHWFEERTAIVSVLLYLGMDEILKAGIGARPYALALTGSLLATYFFLRWLKSGNHFYSVGYVAAMLICFYAHFLYSAIAAVHLIAWISEPLSERKISLKHLLIVGLTGVAGTLPFFYQLRSLVNRHESLYFAISPSLKTVAFTLFPPYVLVYVVAAVLMACIFGVGRGLRLPVSSSFTRQSGITLLFWYLFPPVFFLGYFLFSENSLFLPRLFAWYLPALAILLARLLCSIRPEAARVPAIAVCLSFLLFRELLRVWYVEDWRSIAHYLNTQTESERPFLLYSGLIELENAGWQHAPAYSERGSYLRAPFTVYDAPESLLLSLSGHDAVLNELFTPLASESPPRYFVAYKMRREGIDGGKGYVHEAIIESLTKHNVVAREIAQDHNKKPPVMLFSLEAGTDETGTDETGTDETDTGETDTDESGPDQVEQHTIEP